MKRLNIIHILLIGIAATIIGCNNNGSCGKQYLHDEYRIAFDYNDTLKYKSSNNENMVFVLSYYQTGFFDGYPNSDNPGRDCYYYEFEHIGICPVDQISCNSHVEDTTIRWDEPEPIDCPNCLTIEKKMDTWERIQRNRRIQDPGLMWGDAWSSSVGNNDATHEWLTLNGQQYHYVYEFNTSVPVNNTTITTIYFTYQYGFVGFEDENGVKWNLVLENIF